MNKVLASLVIGALLVGGCATTGEKNAYYAALEAKNQAVAEAAKARAAATAARMEVFKAAAQSTSGDSVKIAAMMAAAFTEGGVGGGGAAADQTAMPQPPGADQQAWLNAAIGFGGLLVQGYAINANKSITTGAQNAQVATAQSTNNMVTTLASAGFASNASIANGGYNAATSIAGAGFGAISGLGSSLAQSLGQPSIRLTGTATL